MAHKYLILALALISSAHAFVSEGRYESISKYEERANDLTTDEEEERLLIIPALTLNISSLSSVLPVALALATSLASLLSTVALAAVVFSLFGKYKYDGYGGGYGSSSGAYTSYSSSPSYRSYFDPSLIDWERFTILDIISVGEEIWSTFNPFDTDCQKRLICEIHQDTESFGLAGERVVDIFGYLNYAKIATFSEDLDRMVDEYIDAADNGSLKDKKCGDLYSGCKFSVEKIAQKLSPNSI